jgi:hypothetical protein
VHLIGGPHYQCYHSCHLTDLTSMDSHEGSLFLMQASAEAVAQRAKEALEHTITSTEPAVNEVPRLGHIIWQEQQAVALRHSPFCRGTGRQTQPCAGYRWLQTADLAPCVLDSCRTVDRNLLHGMQIKGGDKLFVLAVLPKGGVAAKNPE